MLVTNITTVRRSVLLCMISFLISLIYQCGQYLEPKDAAHNDVHRKSSCKTSIQFGDQPHFMITWVRPWAAKVPAELHLYGTGGHGFGVRNDRSIAEETWPARFVDWLKDSRMLRAKK
jgi:hypothetical protein